ncbi:hypothetical protein pdam_00012492 [Pocillopora damicornis]|uniref:Uncharacterized protein n=1 Tax=Pocillopora damicornis TaxID=46731 RepID=A0A3M6TKE5_POCDA|nr:hypothetical protein pdam_00012492 [Pocillopora damicornis]
MANALGFLGTKKQIQILDGCPNNENFFDDVENMCNEIVSACNLKIEIPFSRNRSSTSKKELKFNRQVPTVSFVEKVIKNRLRSVYNTTKKASGKAGQLTYSVYRVAGLKLLMLTCVRASGKRDFIHTRYMVLVLKQITDW